MSGGAILVAVALGGVALGIALLDRHIREGGGARRRPQAARWARKRDLRALEVPSAQQGRVILGRVGRRLIAAERRASVIVVAPTDSRKTTGLAVPALLEWEGPAVATSVKSDLLRATLARRQELGKTMVFDPTGVTGTGKTIRATPLSGCGSWHGAMRVAHWLASSARAGAGGLEDAEFWYAAAEKLIAPLLYAATMKEKGKMADVVRWLNDGSEAAGEVSKLLDDSDAEDAEEARSAWRASCNREERQRSSIYTTAETITAAFADPRVLDASTRAEYTPAELLSPGDPKTLFLCAPAHEQERLRTLFAMMISELVAVVYESAAQTGKPIDPPLLIVLDEAAHIAPVPHLDEIAATGGGQGIQLLSVFQDLAQVHARYGKRAQTIVNNHRARVFGAGVGDPETLRYVSQVTGDAEFRQRSETAGEKGRRSATEGSTFRDLAPANVIREARPGTALLIYGNLPPARLALRPWFEDEGLKTMVDASASGSPT
jgi:type IV secretion system protein VirD4